MLACSFVNLIECTLAEFKLITARIVNIRTARINGIELTQTVIVNPHYANQSHYY